MSLDQEILTSDHKPNAESEAELEDGIQVETLKNRALKMNGLIIAIFTIILHL